MGFGLLFIGYFLHYLLGLNQLATFTSLIGCAVMFAGLSTLSLYCHAFQFARYTTVAMAVTSLYCTAQGLSEMFSITFPFVNDIVSQYVAVIEVFLTVIFHVFLAIALQKICVRTGLKSNAARALTNLVAVVLYAVLWVWYTYWAQINNLVFSFEARSQAGMLYGFTMLMKLIWIFANLILIASCYRRICPAGQGETSNSVKPSRFAFVNTLREKYKKSEDKAINADRAYHQQRYDEQVNKLNAAKKGSKQAQHSRAAKRAEIEAAREAARRRRERDE